jgi:hypothetical protein
VRPTSPSVAAAVRPITASQFADREAPFAGSGLPSRAAAGAWTIASRDATQCLTVSSAEYRQERLRALAGALPPELIG